MREKTLFIKSLGTLFYSWGSDTPDEVYWACNELLVWFEQEYGVVLGIRFDRDEETYESNYDEVIKRIEEI